MIYKITQKEIMALVSKQLENNFGKSLDEVEICEINNASLSVFPKLELNIAALTNKYFFVESDGVKTPVFNPFHSIQWMTFLNIYRMNYISANLNCVIKYII